MKPSAKRLLAAGLCLYTLSGCQALNDLILPPSEEEKLDRQIELERKKQELDKLKQAGQPTPAPTARPTPTPTAGPVNSPPQIKVLDSVLATTVKNNDTVRLIVKASDADGDSLEYNWSSVYNGLSSTKGDSVVWFPGDQNLKGRTNIITVSVTDKKGGNSTASLNIFVQNDGSLLVREDTAAKPVLSSLIATRTDDGRVLLRASATDPAGGLLKYAWSASAGQLTTPEAASTIWQASGASGEITLGLKVTNSAGLQSEGSFRFSRAADGSLSGGFTGTDVTLPATGPLLTGNTPGNIQDNPIQVVGQLLVRQDDTLFRFDPRTRTKTQVINLTTLAGSANYRAQLLYASPAAKAELLLDKSASALGQPSQLIHYALDLSSGNAQPSETLSYDTAKPFPVSVDGLNLSAQPGLATSSNYFLSQGQLKGVFSLYAQGLPTSLRVGDFDVTHLGQPLPAGIRIEAISNQGKILASRNQTELVLIDAATGSEQPLIKLTGLGQPLGYVWNHKGDKIAFATQGSAAGGQSGGSQIYTLDINGQLKQQLTSDLQQDRRDLAWSLDDLYLGFSEYPYVYIQSPSDRRPRAGEYFLIEVDKPANRVSTHLATTENSNSWVVWTP